jgi:hypothetical protein
MEKCYYFVPVFMKPLVLSMIEASILDSATVEVGCSMMVDHANTEVRKSMAPWFSKQLQATDAIASSFDYLLAFFNIDAGQCMDFVSNPFATVLIPEPYDYFAACGSTSMCDLQCGVEISSFEASALLSSQASEPRVQTTWTTSLFFNDRNEDSDMPMRIITMVQLSSCLVLCGDTGVDNTCIAVAGLSSNSTILVKKYCIPKAVGYSVHSIPLETWNVWYSEEWTDSAIDIQFADTLSGDTLVVLRDVAGETNKPRRQYVTIHPRSIQQDPLVWDLYYSTERYRIQHLMFAHTSTSLEQSRGDVTIAITGMFVFPQQDFGQDTYVVLRTLVDVIDGGTFLDDHRGVMCGVLDVHSMIDTRNSYQRPLMECRDPMAILFQTGDEQGNVPLVFQTVSNSVGFNAFVAMIPTVPDTALRIMKFGFDGHAISYFPTELVEVRPQSTVQTSSFPVWQDFSFLKDSLMRVRGLVPDHVAMTVDGVSVRFVCLYIASTTYAFTLPLHSTSAI